MELTKKYLDELSYNVIGAAIEVHKELGPGLLESVYQSCMCHELHLRKINFVSEMKIPVQYKGLKMNVDLRCDFFIENIFVAEIKASKSIEPIHEAQLISYLKLLKAPKGILINFNCVNIFKEGQKTYVSEKYRSLN
ncbi:MAG TPA: GxxExxY protein [Ignavibacteria bacterium]|nr:GxxExxY protein [Ignavibacteria bacterium]HMR39411.1 GxxExxY protein [Ignavibacteria bacterium]